MLFPIIQYKTNRCYLMHQIHMHLLPQISELPVFLLYYPSTKHRYLLLKPEIMETSHSLQATCFKASPSLLLDVLFWCITQIFLAAIQDCFSLISLWKTGNIFSSMFPGILATAFYIFESCYHDTLILPFLYSYKSSSFNLFLTVIIFFLS